MLYHQPNKDLELATLKRSLAANPAQFTASTMARKRKTRKRPAKQKRQV